MICVVFTIIDPFVHSLTVQQTRIRVSTITTTITSTTIGEEVNFQSPQPCDRIEPNGTGLVENVLKQTSEKRGYLFRGAGYGSRDRGSRDAGTDSGDGGGNADGFVGVDDTGGYYCGRN